MSLIFLFNFAGPTLGFRLGPEVNLERSVSLKPNGQRAKRNMQSASVGCETLKCNQFTHFGRTNPNLDPGQEVEPASWSACNPTSSGRAVRVLARSGPVIVGLALDWKLERFPIRLTEDCCRRRLPLAGHPEMLARPLRPGEPRRPI
jgi:hypothetical protein